MVLKLFIAEPNLQIIQSHRIFCDRCGKKYKFAVGRYCAKCLRQGVEHELTIERVVGGTTDEENDKK